MTRAPRLATLLVLGLTAPLALAHEEAPADNAATMPGPLKEVRFDQRLGVGVPRDLHFRDEAGGDVTLSRYFDGGKPVVLALVYYRCSMLCGQVLVGLTAAIKPLELTPGRDFEVVIVSFDPTETPADAAKMRAAFLERLGRPEAASGWHHLVGDASATAALGDAVGFHATKDPATGEWAHASGIVVATPDGTLARYLFGIEYSARDLKLALVEAGQGTVGSFADQLLLYCYHYDPVHGRYSAAVMGAVRVLGGITVLALAAFVWRSSRTGAPIPSSGGNHPAVGSDALSGRRHA